MLTYDTGIQAKPPINPAMQQKALAGLHAYGQMQYPGPAQDVYDGRATEAGVDYERATTAANNKFMAEAQQAQQDTALRGLQQMSQAQQNDNNLANQRQQMSLDYAGKLFGGMNSMLSGLFSNV